MAKHEFVRDEAGRVDEWRLEYKINNGPQCRVCEEFFCIHCEPTAYKDECPGPQAKHEVKPELNINVLQGKISILQDELQGAKFNRELAVQECERLVRLNDVLRNTGREWAAIVRRREEKLAQAEKDYAALENKVTNLMADKGAMASTIKGLMERCDAQTELLADKSELVWELRHLLEKAVSDHCGCLGGIDIP